MKKQISFTRLSFLKKNLGGPKIVSLVFGVLIICFAIGFYVFAWTEPTDPPPGGNIPAPINIGDTTQYKSGALGIGGLFQTDNETHLAILGGNVGIGTTSPGAKLGIYSTSGFGHIEIKGADVAKGHIGFFGNTTYVFNNAVYNGSSWSSDDAARASWGIKLDSVNDEFRIDRAPAGSTSFTQLMKITSSGSVGIGDTSPDSGTGGQLKLDVEGPIGATKYCDKFGNNCRTATELFVATAWASPWFDATIGTTYEFTHNLGSDALMLQFFCRPSAGSNRIISINHVHYGAATYGIASWEITSTTIKVVTGNTAPFSRAPNPDGSYYDCVGQLRVLAMRID